MLDKYVSGSVSRISPEAPVPVVKVDSEWTTLGGAANVAANVNAFGGKATLVGLVGKDQEAQFAKTASGITGIHAVLFECDQPTIVKTRVLAGQQIVRFDREEPLIWSEAGLKALTDELSALVIGCDVILLSDYAKGTLSDSVLKLIFDVAKEQGKPVVVDPKRADWTAYSGAFLISPNLAELTMTQGGKKVRNEDNEVVSVCRKLRDQFGLKHVLATRSSYGMTLISEGTVLNIPTRAQEVFDVSGAGDTVLAAFGVSLGEGNGVSESAFMANAAAGIAVSKRGTAVVHRTELNNFLTGGSKEISRGDIPMFQKKHTGKKMIFTNGCFDVLHQGHRKLLQEARTLGDLLVVGLNSDASIKRLKGDSRPLNPVGQRIEALTALPYVDAIIEFEEDTPYELIQQLKPQILVKGGDYRPKDVVGADLVDEVVIVPLVEGISTTSLCLD